MELTQEQLCLIHRYLDGNISSEELVVLNTLMVDSRSAREYLLDVSEQVMVAGDLLNLMKSSEATRKAQLGEFVFDKRVEGPGYSKAMVWYAITFLSSAIFFACATTWTVLASFRSPKPVVATIKHAHGLLDLRAHSGGQVTRLEEQQHLYAGDILESKSCDSWLEMDIGFGSQLTLANHSSIRMLQSPAGDSRDYELLRGGLWVDAQKGQGNGVRIVTPTATIAATDSTLNVRVTDTETGVWVHRGQATVTQAKDGQSATLQAGIELSLSLEESGSLLIKPHAAPIHEWVLQWPLDHRYAYGRLMSEPGEAAKLKAMPMLWPIPGRDPLLLHVSAVGAWGVSSNPIVIREGSVLRFRGRSETPYVVRFGFSTQKLQGVFGGKFEVDIQPDQLAGPGEIWHIDLPIDRFRALYPQLSNDPSGLQLIDVYALTVQEDIGLEILGVELLGPDKR